MNFSILSLQRENGWRGSIGPLRRMHIETSIFSCSSFFLYLALTRIKRVGMLHQGDRLISCIYPVNQKCSRIVMVNLWCVSKVTRHNILGWRMSVQQHPTTTILKSMSVSLHDFQRLRRRCENGVCSYVTSAVVGSCMASGDSKNCTRTGRAFVQCLEAAEELSPNLLQEWRLLVTQSSIM